MIFKKIGNMENVEIVCHYFNIVDSSIQALARKHAQFYFGNINQLPCLGVYTNSNLSHNAFALSGGNAS